MNENICRFCSGKFISKNDGEIMIQVESKASDHIFIGNIRNCSEKKDGICYSNGNLVVTTNISGNQNIVKLGIKYCPFCGKKLG